MYTVIIEKTTNNEVLHNIPLDRAIVYKRRWRKRGVNVEIISEVCADGVCRCEWKPTGLLR